MDSLYKNSLRIIKDKVNRNPGHTLPAPIFPLTIIVGCVTAVLLLMPWIRLANLHSAKAFFRWVGRTIQKYGSKVEDFGYRLEAGLPIGKDDVLHTRYTLDGDEVTADSTWGNFQIDGYGTWLLGSCLSMFV